MKSKKYRVSGFVAVALMATALAEPVKAAFFFEGLESYSMRHCKDVPADQLVRQGVSDPVILHPDKRDEARKEAERDFRKPCPAQAPSKLYPLPPK